LWTSIIVRNLMIMHRYDEASDELDKVRFQSFELAGLQTLLQLREHGDLQRWGMEFLALKSEYEGVAKPHDFWSAYIALRDFSAAEASLTGPKGLPIPGIAAIIEGYPFGALQLAVTQWLVQRSERPDDPDLDWSGTLEELLAESTRLDTNQAQLIEALQAGARGDPAEAERLVRRWRRMIAGDLAEQGQLIHFSCRVLGLTGAIEATVECIRNSLVEPSYVMPFYEPFLPYYDQIRVEPEFVELLAEID